MTKKIITSAMEDYLKAIYELGESGVKTQALANELEVSPASVTGMLKKLADLKLVKHEKYYGVSLSKAGRMMALETLRHHRLLETYLAEALGYEWHEVHSEAEKLEHHISEDFEDRIDEALGYPTHDPHGDPIPRRDGSVPAIEGKPLTDYAVGDSFIITRIRNQDSEVLQYLAENHLRLGNRFELKQKAPRQGPITLERDGSHVALAYSLAQAIFAETSQGVSDGVDTTVIDKNLASL